jgi:tight adherence protein B
MPTVIVGVGLLAVLMILLGTVVGKRRKQAPDELIERMGRFATREEMLAVVDSSGNKHKPNNMAVSIEQMLQGRSITERAANSLTRADSHLTVGEFLLFRFLAAAGGFVVGFIILGLIVPSFAILTAIIFTIIGFMVPQVVIAIKGKMRIKRFVRQLGDTITLMSNSLRAGYSLLQAQRTRLPASSAASYAKLAWE